jgi:hypothetical protein
MIFWLRRNVIGSALAVGMAAGSLAVCLLALPIACAGSNAPNSPSPTGTQPTADAPATDTAPVVLSAVDVPDFITWALLYATKSQLNDQIIAARTRAGVLDALFAELDKYWYVSSGNNVITDEETAALIIGIIRTLELPDSIERSNALALRPYPTDMPLTNPDGSPTIRYDIGLLEEAAVEVLLCLPSSTSAQSDLDTLASTHPAAEVRNLAATKDFAACFF